MISGANSLYEQGSELLGFFKIFLLLRNYVQARCYKKPSERVICLPQFMRGKS